MKKIGIKFHDNDFYVTFTSLLYMLYEANKESKDLTSDKTKLAFIINSAIYGCYAVFQNRCRYGEEKDLLDNKRLKEYLTITPNDIIIDSEIDAHLNSDTFWNGEFFWIDLHNGNVGVQ